MTVITHRHARYRELLSAFLSGGYKFTTVRRAATEPVGTPFVVLRHDVEWNSERAVALAHIERDYDIQSTYYFRVDTKALDYPNMHKLERMGCEIGYHYNTLDRTHGDFDRARRLFELELAQLRQGGLDITTATPHGDPRARRVGYVSNSDLFARSPDLLSKSALLDIGPYGKRFPIQGNVMQISDASVQWNRGEITWPFFFRTARERSIPGLMLLVHSDYWSRSYARATGVHAAALALRTLRLRSSSRRVRRMVTERIDWSGQKR